MTDELVVPALDPDTLEPIAEDADQLEAEATPLAEAFGGVDAYRDGVAAAIKKAGG